MTERVVRPSTDRAGRAPDAERRWGALLRDLEELIERQRLVLDAGGPTDAHALVGLFFAPPDDLPPLPASLVGRAQELLAATRALADRAQQVAAPSRPTVRPTTGRSRARSTFDRRA